jgi:hypothetical protein
MGGFVQTTSRQTWTSKRTYWSTSRVFWVTGKEKCSSTVMFISRLRQFLHIFLIHSCNQFLQIFLIHFCNQFLYIFLIHFCNQFLYIFLIHSCNQFLHIFLIHSCNQFLHIFLIRSYDQFLHIFLIHSCNQFLHIFLIHSCNRFLHIFWIHSCNLCALHRNIFSEKHSFLFLVLWFLGAFTKLRKATVSFMSVCLPVCMELGSQSTDFDETWYLILFRKSVGKIQISLKSDKITGTLHDDVSIFLTIFC